MPRCLTHAATLTLALVLFAPQVAKAAAIPQNAINPPANAITDKGTGITSWTWLTPEEQRLSLNKSVVYGVGAKVNQGVKRIEIVVNGRTRQICAPTKTPRSLTCKTTLTANDYPIGTGVFVNAKITNGRNRFTWTNGATLYRDITGSSSITAASIPTVTTWSWFEPSNELPKGSQTTFHVGAWAEAGLRSIEIRVNGLAKKTCELKGASGNQECSLSISGDDYPVGSIVEAIGKAHDANGRTEWGELKTIALVSKPTPASPAGTLTVMSAPTAWEWVEVARDFATLDETFKYVIGGWDAVGVVSITPYVNGVARSACTFTPVKGGQRCVLELTGAGFLVGATVELKALVRNNAGQETWTTGKQVPILGTDATTLKDWAENGWINVWTNTGTFIRANEILSLTAEGSDPDGTQRIEIDLNGEKVSTCSASNTTKRASCSATVGPFPNQTALSYTARLVDRFGYKTTNEVKQLSVVK